MNASERPSRVDEPISPKTADALLAVMAYEGVSLAEALRRLVGYGELVFRTIRLEGGHVLIRHGDEFRQIALLDQQGDGLVRSAPLLVWMRPQRSMIACAFHGAHVVAGLASLDSIRNCGPWPTDELVEDDQAERCPACHRAAKRMVGSR